MHDLYDNLEELCETVAEEIQEANVKIKNAGGKISPGDVEYLDKLTHMLKSVKTTKAMMEAEEGYSGYEGSNSSYARGRGSNANRDSRGRYSNAGRSNRGRSYDDMSYGRSYEGRSYGGDMVSELRELMNEAPNTQIRNKFQQFIEEVERMR